MAEVPIARAGQILQSRVSGVQVTQVNSEPDGGVSVRIRGTKQQRANVNTDGGSTGGTGLDALRFNPAVPVRDASGQYSLDNQPQPQPYVEIGGNPVWRMPSRCATSTTCCATC